MGSRTIAHMDAIDGAAVGFVSAAGSFDLHGCRSTSGALPLRQITGAEGLARCWFLGVHGGAGESTLTALFAGFAAANHQWPVSSRALARSRVVLCARTNFWGMTAVMHVAGQWDAAGLRDRVAMPLGLVLIADRPGRLPKSLEAFARHLEAATDHVWRLPWVEAWAAGEVPSPANCPKEAHALRVGLTAALEAARKVGK